MSTPTYSTISPSKLTLKKHQRIKSQQQLTPTYTSTSYPKRLSQYNIQQYNNNYPTTNTYLIQIIKNSYNNVSTKSIKILIPHKTKLQKLKNIVCERIKQNQDQIYFYTVNPHVDYNFDYCLEEGIGVIDRDCKLGYNTKEIQKDQCGNVLQGSTIADYHIYNCLSVGGFSKVFLTRSKKTGKFYAAKFISKNFDKSTKFRQLIHNEKYINQLIDYPLLVKMHKFIQSKQFYIFILDYCPAGELFTLMKLHRQMGQDQAKFYFIQTILAIDYMHQKNIIYRDIKPENILLDKDGHIKIADFGLAKILREKRTMSYCGSLEYMAPEIVLGNQYSFGVDYYCLGSLLFQLMIGCPPFYNPNYTPSQTKYHIANSEVSFPNVKPLSHQFVDFVTRLLDKNPKTRLGSIAGIKQILLHPWIGKFQREKYQKKQIKPPYINSLDQSNFQTTYLPIEAIKQIKKKINIEIQQINKQRVCLQKKSNNLNILQLSSKQIIKSIQKANQNCVIPSTLSINKRKISNPYSTIKSKNTNKQKLLCYLSKNFYDKSTKSLHSSKNQSKTKKRSFTANVKHQSQQSSAINSSKYQNTPKDNQKLYKNFQKQKFEKIRTQNNTLNRKSGTHQKQNDFKTKFDNKAKEMKKIYGIYLRNSQIQQWNKDKNNSIKKVAYNINQALIHALQR